MDDDLALRIKIDSVYFEETINSIIESCEGFEEAGVPRELLLHDISVLIARSSESPAVMACIAGVAIMMIMEERRR